MTPQTKKLASAFLVTSIVAILGMLGQYAVHLPSEMKMAAASIIAGAVHFINAWGHTEREDEAVAAKVTAIVEQER